MNRKLLLFIANILGCCLLCAQSVEQVFHWQNDFPLSVDYQVFSEQNMQFVGGTFRTNFSNTTASHESLGGSDIFLTAMNASGEIIWSKSGGSERNDLLEAMAYFDQYIFSTGTYWIEAQFDDLKLETSGSPQGIFLLQYDTTGNLIKGITLNGNGNKEVHDLITDKDGNLLLAGSFSGNLEIGDTILSAAEEHFFLLKFDASMNLLWAKQATKVAGQSKGIALATLANEQIILAGNFLGTLIVGADSLTTDTEDEDIFLLSYTAAGEKLWLREAGGVFPSFVRDMVASENEFWVGGNFRGRIELDDSFSIESRGLNEDIFLLQYDRNGNNLFATPLGGAATESISSLSILEDQILIGGFFLDNFEMDNFRVEGDADSFDGFVLNYDTNSKKVDALKALPADDNLFVKDIAFTANRQLSVIGDFIGTANLDNFTFTANTFNPFIAHLSNQNTAIEPSLSTSVIQIKTKQNWLNIISDFSIKSIEIYDLEGKLLAQNTGKSKILIAQLASGIYAVKVLASTGVSSSALFFKD
ncbi:MAG: T9SS type A sorting domain-containing protein [Bacteroidota bacterium]